MALSAVKFTPDTAGSVAGNLAFGIVPLPKLVAFKAVKFTPDTAGSVAGNLAFGTVPDVNCVASKLVTELAAH